MHFKKQLLLRGAAGAQGANCNIERTDRQSNVKKNSTTKQPGILGGGVQSERAYKLQTVYHGPNLT